MLARGCRVRAERRIEAADGCMSHVGFSMRVIQFGANCPERRELGISALTPLAEPRRVPMAPGSTADGPV